MFIWGGFSFANSVAFYAVVPHVRREMRYQYLLSGLTCFQNSHFLCCNDHVWSTAFECRYKNFTIRDIEASFCCCLVEFDFIPIRIWVFIFYHCRIEVQNGILLLCTSIGNCFACSKQQRRRNQPTSLTRLGRKWRWLGCQNLRLCLQLIPRCHPPAWRRGLLFGWPTEPFSTNPSRSTSLI